MSAPALAPGPNSTISRPLLWLVVLPLLLLGWQLVTGAAFVAGAPAAFEPWKLEDPARAKHAELQLDTHALDGLVPVWSDRRAAREALLQGEFPSWDHRAGLGAPLAGQSVAGMLYPPNLATLWLPPERVLGWLALLSLWLAGVALYAWLRAHGLGQPAALLAAIAWQGGSWVLTHAHLSCKLDSVSWMLLASAALQAHLAGRERWLPAMAACVGLSFLAGFPQLAVLGLGALALQLACARCLQPVPWQRILLALPFLLIGIALAAVWLLPLIEASAQSLRQAQSAAQLDAGRLPLGALASVLIPDLFGAPQDGIFAPANAVAWMTTGDASLAAVANGLEWNLYAGALVLAAAIAACARPSRQLILPGVLVLVSLGCALRVPPLGWLLELPGLSSGAPARSAVGAVLGLIWLGAHGMERWLERDVRALWIGVSVLALSTLGALWVATGMATGVAASADPAQAALQWIEHWSQVHTVPRATVEGTLPLDELVRQMHLLQVHAWWAVLASITGLVVLSVLLSQRVQRHGVRSWGLLVLAALVLTPYLGARRTSAQTTAAGSAHESFVPRSSALEATQAAVGNGRLIRYDRSFEGTADVERLLRPGLAQACGLADATPWIVFQPRTLVELWSAADRASLWRSGIARATSVEALEGRIADELRLQCVLARSPITSSRLQVVHSLDGYVVHSRSGSKPLASWVSSLHVCEDDAAVLRNLRNDVLGVQVTRAELQRHGLDTEMPPASAAMDGAEIELATTRPAPSRFEVQLQDQAVGWVIVREQWTPDWTALVDGQPAPVVRVNHALRAIPVPAGARTIALHYEARQLRLGAVVSLLAALVLYLVWKRGVKATEHSAA